MLIYFRWLSCVCSTFCCVGLCLAQGELAEPFPVQTGGATLDVKLHGAAAPCVVDFDGDGANDLLVGEKYGGRLRIYHNFGASDRPRFDGYSLFKEGMPAGCVPDNNGFCPAIADVDRDGRLDLLTPAWHGHIRWFRQESPGVFGAAQPVLDAEGNTIRVEWTHGVSSCDWDADGYPDLIVGSSGDGAVGSLSLWRNIGAANEAAAPRFERPVAIRAGDKPIFVPERSPAPVAVDWDGDQLFDLIVGTRQGNVAWYRNQGTAGRPSFDAARELIGVPPPGGERGTNAIVSVADWNGDGRLDLLVGDTGEKFEKKLTDEEQQAKAFATTQRDQAFSRWANVFRTYRRLTKLQDSGSQRAVIDAARVQLMKLRDEQTLHHLAQQEIQEGRQWHGRVWVFLRKN